MLAMLKTEWTKGLIAGAALTVVATAAMMALPELVSQKSATTVQKELRHIHLDHAASSNPAIEQRHLKLSSTGLDDIRGNDDLDVGDRLTIAGKNGLKSVLEIVSVKVASVRLTASTDGPANVLKVVMARDVERSDRPLVRLIFDAGVDGTDAPEKSAQTPQAL